MNQCLHAWLQNTLGENALQLGQLGACCHFSTLEVEARGPRFKVVLSKSEASLGSWRSVSNRGRDQGVGRHNTAWYCTCYMLHHRVDLNPQTDVKGRRSDKPLQP